MALIIAMMALAFLMFAAYRGYSVILCAPVAALAAVLLTEPAAVAPVFPASSWRSAQTIARHRTGP